MNHKQLIDEADELFDNLKKQDRERMVFRWSFVGNRELGDVLSRLGRLEKLMYGTVLVGILALILAKALGG